MGGYHEKDEFVEGGDSELYVSHEHWLGIRAGLARLARRRSGHLTREEPAFEME
jgi:hypothetical protein